MWQKHIIIFLRTFITSRYSIQLSFPYASALAFASSNLFRMERPQGFLSKSCDCAYLNDEIWSSIGFPFQASITFHHSPTNCFHFSLFNVASFSYFCLITIHQNLPYSWKKCLCMLHFFCFSTNTFLLLYSLYKSFNWSCMSVFIFRFQ